jgi:hypothetical protein
MIVPKRAYIKYRKKAGQVGRGWSPGVPDGPQERPRRPAGRPSRPPWPPRLVRLVGGWSEKGLKRGHFCGHNRRSLAPAWGSGPGQEREGGAMPAPWPPRLGGPGQVDITTGCRDNGFNLDRGMFLSFQHRATHPQPLLLRTRRWIWPQHLSTF